MEKRQADGSADRNELAAKRGRWDSGPLAAATPNPAASAAALAAAVAAKYAQPPGVRPSGLVLGVASAVLPGATGPSLPVNAAAAVAQAAAAALHILPTAAADPVGTTSAALAAGPAAGAAKVPNLEALEKAKKALQLQKEIQEKLKSRLPQLAAKLPTPSVAGGPATSAPAAVAIPAAGPAPAPVLGTAPGVVTVRPALGNAMRIPGVPAALAAAAATLVPGGATPARGVALGTKAGGIASVLPPPASAAPPEPPPEDDRFHDPTLDHGAAARRGERRRRAGFDFVQEGRFQREAELFRLKSQLGPAGFRKGAPRVSGPLLAHAGAAGGDPNRIPLGGGGAAVDANSVPLGVREKPSASREATPAPVAEPIPAVEWWDRGLLAHASLEQDVPELPAEVEAALTEALGAAMADAERGGAEDAEEGAGMGEDEGEPGRGTGKAGAVGSDDDVMADAAGVAKPRYRAPRAAGHQAREALAAAVQQAAAAAAAGRLGPFNLKDARITIYVEHPVPLDPPAEAPPPGPQPLKLTQRELKKLRTQRRMAREKEKQELVRQGLLEPPKPKVRIANLHRVLGTDAALDPTAVEKEVRKQMAERQAAHDDRNLARKLTPAELKEKKLRKLFGAAAIEAGVTNVSAGRGGAGKRGAAAAAAAAAEAAAAAAGVDIICSVYRVGRLTDPSHRFKVDANARENHMTGIMIVSDDFCVVVVEGVEKATRRYTKLMMRRIDWSAAPAADRGPMGRDANGDAAMDEDDDEEDRPPPNTCTLVWQGTVLRRAFNGFRSETVRSAAAGRQLLEDMGVAHYWDAAAGATEDESVPYAI